MNYWDIENKFYFDSDPTRLTKIIYQYEIYKKIIDLPGEILECGVFKGNSFKRFLVFRDFLENVNSRKIIGFDVFGKFPKQARSSDNLFSINHNKVAGYGYEKKYLESNYKKKGFKNFELVKGDIHKTLPIFIKNNPNLKISLLHLDLDVYQPTSFALNQLKDRIVKNGLILVDDYNVVEGATKAVDEFLYENNLSIKKLCFLPNPSYISIK